MQKITKQKTPQLRGYFICRFFFMHLVQIFLRLPSGKVAHCKLGYFLFLGVGLYLPLSKFLLPPIIVPFPQSGHSFAIYRNSL